MPETGMVIAIQVSAFYRAHHGINHVDSTCRIIAALYKEIPLNIEERLKLTRLTQADFWLKSVDRNYTLQMSDLNNQFRDTLIDRANLRDFSHNINMFFIVEVYQDGTLRYRYIF